MRYRKLCEGGFSNVFLCRSQRYNQNFAVKRAIKSKLTDYECNALIYLAHPNIIKLYDEFNDENAHYLVMEYCPNKTLRQKSCLNYNQFIYYAKQILEAIAYCHSNNIAHRDIKPENIFLDQYNMVKLADFGMANHYDENCRPKHMCGSLKFFAPELFEFQNVCPFKADIWALGITFYFMVTGTLPFESNSLEEMKRLATYGEIDLKSFNIDGQIIYLIKKMTEKNPKLRPSAEELLKLPIFTQNSNIKHCMLLNKTYSKCRTNSNISWSKSYTFDLSNEQSNLLENNPNNQTIINVHSFKCDFLYNGPHKLNFHFKINSPK